MNETEDKLWKAIKSTLFEVLPVTEYEPRIIGTEGIFNFSNQRNGIFSPNSFWVLFKDDQNGVPQIIVTANWSDGKFLIEQQTQVANIPAKIHIFPIVHLILQLALMKSLKSTFKEHKVHLGTVIIVNDHTDPDVIGNLTPEAQIAITNQIIQMLKRNDLLSLSDELAQDIILVCSTKPFEKQKQGALGAKVKYLLHNALGGFLIQILWAYEG